jgi:hypothetical protein
VLSISLLGARASNEPCCKYSCRLITRRLIPRKLVPPCQQHTYPRVCQAQYIYIYIDVCVFIYVHTHTHTSTKSQKYSM